MPFKNAFSRFNLTSQEQRGEVQLFPGILSAQGSFNLFFLVLQPIFSMNSLWLLLFLKCRGHSLFSPTGMQSCFIIAMHIETVFRKCVKNIS